MHCLVKLDRLPGARQRPAQRRAARRQRMQHDARRRVGALVQQQVLLRHRHALQLHCRAVGHDHLGAAEPGESTGGSSGGRPGARGGPLLRAAA